MPATAAAVAPEFRANALPFVDTSPRIVALGGGTGLPAVLEGLRLAAESGPARTDDLCAVVTVTDDGGSSGRLRRELGVLPPGDLRNCLAALAPEGSPLKALLQYRFPQGGALDGHALGNLMLTALADIRGDFVGAVEQLSAMLGIRGRVLPTTVANVQLRAVLESGAIVTGETAIVSSGEPVRRLHLEPSPKPLPDVIRALVNADAVVVGPGSLYSSILPNLLVEGIAATISGVRAVRICVANLMTEPGETDGYTLDDHLRAIRLHAGFDLFDYILVHRGPLCEVATARYASQGSRRVAVDQVLRWAGKARVIEGDFALADERGRIRHAPRRLAETIRRLAVEGRRMSSMPAA
jgi:uncharacterized cofD-like protein